MILTRGPWCALAIVSALAVGCSSEKNPPEPPASNPSTTAPGPAPETPPGPAPSKATDKDGGPSAAAAASAPAKADASVPSDLKIEAPKIEAPRVEPAPKGDEPKGVADDGKLSDLEIAQIKTLPADEQAAALKQVVCPVSDEHLGSMKTPVKVTAEGKTFYLCCKGCKKQLEEDPKAIVAKLTGK